MKPGNKRSSSKTIQYTKELQLQKKTQNTGEGWDIQNVGHTDCCAMKNADIWKGMARCGHWSKGGGSLSRC